MAVWKTFLLLLLPRWRLRRLLRWGAAVAPLFPRQIAVVVVVGAVAVDQKTAGASSRAALVEAQSAAVAAADGMMAGRLLRVTLAVVQFYRSAAVVVGAAPRLPRLRQILLR